MSEDLGERVREATRDLMRGLSLQPVEIKVNRERGRLLVRISIDKPGGVTVDDCARASGMIGQVLEREDLMPGEYTLEVMSPGIKRALRKPEDFARYTGKRIKVVFREATGKSRSITGMLESAGPESLTLDTGSESIELRYEDLTSARLDPQLPW